MKLQAKALVYAIVVSVFVAIISIALIKLAEINRFITLEQAEQERLTRNLHSGINIVLNSTQDVKPQYIDLFNKKKDSIIISKSKWGFFNVGLVSAFINNMVLKDTIQKIFLIGAKKSKILDFALYTPFSNTSLTISGKTLIKGNVILPKEGIKSENIEGQTYTNSKLFYGQQFLPNASPPTINKGFLSSIIDNYNVSSPKCKTISKSINNSFIEKTLYVEGDSLLLDSCIISGNIVIKGKKSVTIGTNCQITDAIIIAPVIYFKSGFQGSLQAFAFERLIAESNTNFYYPSILALIENNTSLTKPKFIKFNKHSLLEGLLLFTSETFNPQKTYISIEEDALIRGQVFIDRFGSLELKGSVHGNITTPSFYRSMTSSLYDNVIVGGTIDHSLLSPSYSSSLFLNGDKEMVILKWVY